jgi:hypothetical protein
MRWNFGFNQSDLKQAKSFEPLKPATIAWLVMLLGVYAVAGMSLSRADVPVSIAVLVLLSAVALAWLKTYSWLTDMSQNLAGFLMPIAGVMAGLVGACVPMLLGQGKPTNIWYDNLPLLGLLPATAAFRGSLSVVNWIEPLQQAIPKLQFLNLFPLVLLLSTCFCLIFYGFASAGMLNPGLAQILSIIIVALPTAGYLYLAYTLLPKLVGEQVDNFLSQLSSQSPVMKDMLDKMKQGDKPIDISVIDVAPEALPGETAGEYKPSQNPDIPKNLEDMAQQTPQGHWLVQVLVLGIPLVIGSLLLSYLYWKINQWLGAVLVFGMDLGLPGDVSVNWGWDWFKGWAVAWVVAVMIAIVRVAKRIKLWLSLLYTLSIIGGALLIPTALLWAERAGWAAISGVAWAIVLGVALAQSAWGLEKTVPAKSSFFVLSIVSLLGLGLGRFL